MIRKALIPGYLSLALVLAGLVTRNGYLVALALPFLLYLGAGTLRRPGELHLKVTRTLSSDCVQAGTPVEIKVVVQNEGNNLEELLLEDFIPRQAELVKGTTQILTPLRMGETAEFTYTLRTNRGSFAFNHVRATASEPLGLFPQTQLFPTSSRLIVMPVVTAALRPVIRPLRTHGFAGPIPAREGGVGTDFFGLREYQMGDPRRRINWRVSARQDQELFTNEFEQERIAQVGLILDAREQSNLETGRGSLFEYSVQAAASLAESFISQGNRVGLLVYGYGIVRTFPGYGKVQLERILRSLAEATPGHSYVLENLDYLPTQFFPARSQIVMISPLLNSDLPVLMRLRALGYQLIVVSPDPISFEESSLPGQARVELATRIARIERTVLLHNLARVGIQVVDWLVSRSFQQVAELALRRPPQWNHQLNISR